MYCPSARIVTCTLAVLLVMLGFTQPASALRKKGTWDIQTKALPDARAGGWFINLGITGARARILVESPKILEVTFVFEQTPAFGKLRLGDKIVTGAELRSVERCLQFLMDKNVHASCHVDTPLEPFVLAESTSPNNVAG